MISTRNLLDNIEKLMEINPSQSNSAAEFLCFLHDCGGRIDFSFDRKQWQVLKNCEGPRWGTDSCLLCPEKNVTGACMPWSMNQNKRGNRQSALLAISASRLWKIALIVAKG